MLLLCRIPHQRYVIESVGVYEKGEVPPHLSWLPKTQEGGAVEYEVKNRVELKGSNHSKCNRPHDLLTTGKNERPFDKALAKRKVVFKSLFPSPEYYFVSAI